MNSHFSQVPLAAEETLAGKMQNVQWMKIQWMVQHVGWRIVATRTGLLEVNAQE
jgi:hypothetical protein